MRKITMGTHLIHLIVLFQTVKMVTSAISKTGCPNRCKSGSVIIPYPFGIGSSCSTNQNFTITCKNSKPFLTSINLEVLEIVMSNKTIRLNNPITTFGCNSRRGTHIQPVNFGPTPFSYSTTYNLLTGIGCDIIAELVDLSNTSGTPIAGCASFCSTNDRSNKSGCYGIDCCKTTIHYDSVKAVNLSLTSTSTAASSNCRYGFIVEQQWFENLKSPYAVQGMDYVPVVMNWEINAMCFSILDSAEYICSCKKGYEGNPHLPYGCEGVSHNECKVYKNTCLGKCKNTPGGYECSDIQKSNKTFLMIIVGISSGLGAILLIIGTGALCKIIKRRKQLKLKKKYFKRNGGLLFEQLCPSSEQTGTYVETIKLFTSKELEIATDFYNKNRILGLGGQGTVYKGMLTDGKIVAVKKSTKVDEGKLEEFINEVVILSQINHRNVVKLHGCCLETEVPLLLYEFIPNGTLQKYIQDKQNEEFPLIWNVRLRIASEIAGALDYLHSAASIPIYHRDIKSTNILLDEKYRAKVSDFGTSRTLQVDQTHLTTRVQGTFGYFDPEYYRSSQYTAKSDVYSFGVVLLELLTGHKAIMQTDETCALSSFFITRMDEDRLFDIVDGQILKEGARDEILATANLARRCLSLSGKKRPTMKEVAMELETIRTSTDFTNRPLLPEEQYEEDEYSITDMLSQGETTTFSTTSRVEDKPLITN